MADQSVIVRSLWSLTVLCFLRERPLHPYEIRQLVEVRNKNQFLDLKRGSIYHAVEQLRRAGLIEPIETIREGRRPERTVYRLTHAGELEVVAWLADLLRNPSDTTQGFFAALSFLPHLPPNDVANALVQRAELLSKRIDNLDQSLTVLSSKIGRVLLLESELARAAQQSELSWVQSLIDEIRSGKVTWSPVPSYAAEEGVGIPSNRKV